MPIVPFAFIYPMEISSAPEDSAARKCKATTIMELVFLKFSLRQHKQAYWTLKTQYGPEQCESSL